MWWRRKKAFPVFITVLFLTHITNIQICIFLLEVFQVLLHYSENCIKHIWFTWVYKEKEMYKTEHTKPVWLEDTAVVF